MHFQELHAVRGNKAGALDLRAPFRQRVAGVGSWDVAGVGSWDVAGVGSNLYAYNGKRPEGLWVEHSTCHDDHRASPT